MSLVQIKKMSLDFSRICFQLNLCFHIFSCNTINSIHIYIFLSIVFLIVPHNNATGYLSLISPFNSTSESRNFKTHSIGSYSFLSYPILVIESVVIYSQVVLQFCQRDFISGEDLLNVRNFLKAITNLKPLDRVGAGAICSLKK